MMLGCNSGNFDTTRSGANRIQDAASGGTGTWSLYQSPEGHAYYHNEILGQSVWAADFAQCDSEQTEISFTDTGSRTCTKSTRSRNAFDYGVDNFSYQSSVDETFELDSKELSHSDGHDGDHSSHHMMPIMTKVAKKRLNSKSKRSNPQNFRYHSKVGKLCHQRD